MRFLEIVEIEFWCNERGIALADGEARLAPDPRLCHRSRVLYATGGRSGREPEVAEAAIQALGQWDECLLWITLVGVWSSGEDWPAYYALRGTEGERRSLGTAPGHLFAADEQSKLTRFLTAAMENGWDAWALPARGGWPTEVRLRVSHDEWVELQASTPSELAAPAV
jgi:hypothetical protein